MDDSGISARRAPERVSLSAQTDPEFNFEQAQIAAQEAIDVFEEVSDESGLAEAYLQLGKFSLWLGRSAEADAAFTEAAAHGRRAGDRRAESRSLAWLGVALPQGNLPVPVAIDRASEILQNAAEDRSVQATVLTCRASLFASQRRFDEARRDLAAGRDIHRELGAMLDWCGTASNGATIHLLAGDPEAAEDLLREALEALDEMGETGYTSTLQAQLAQALYAQERYDEALRGDGAQRAGRRTRRHRCAGPLEVRPGEAAGETRKNVGSGGDGSSRRRTRRGHGSRRSLRRRTERPSPRSTTRRGGAEERTTALKEALRVYEARENLVGADRVGASSPRLKGRRPGGRRLSVLRRGRRSAGFPRTGCPCRRPATRRRCSGPRCRPRAPSSRPSYLSSRCRRYQEP